MLTTTELQDRLLDFVCTRLVRSDADFVVNPRTRLFEDKIIDSLKILELIAYLEATVGHKIPDAQVVLANFRSIETMARVFSTGGEEPETRARKTRRALGIAGTERIFSNSIRPRNYTDPAVALGATRTGESAAERSDVVRDGEGGIDLSGSALSLVSYLDATVAAWARELGAVEEVFADTIRMSTLDRAGFIAAFPQKLVAAPDERDFALPPAVCYHHYPYLAGKAVDAPGGVITAIGKCYRNESDDEHPLERLRAFTMREIVAVGSESFVENLRRDLIERVSRLIVELDLDGFIATASDPFFTRDTRGRRLMQQLQPLKYELRLSVAKSRTVAAASFNNHQDHFGRAFSIRQENGDIAHSGCVAFGWERWLVAMAAQHGAHESQWAETPGRRHAVAY